MEIVSVTDKDAFMSERVAMGWRVTHTVVSENEPIFDEDGFEVDACTLTEYHMEDCDGYAGVLTYAVGSGWTETEFTVYTADDFCDY